MTQTGTRLIFQGLLLFFLSLLTGLLLVVSTAFVANPRGVLAGHLEGAMNGIFIMVVGAFFDRVRLSDAAGRVCRATLLYGGFGNWAFTTLAGVLGTSESTPLAGAGHHGGVVMERLVLFGLGSVALSILVAVVLLLVGVRRAVAPRPLVEPL